MSNLDSTSVLPGPVTADDQEERVAPKRARRTGRIVNAVIAGALLLVVALIVWTLRGTSDEPVSTAQTASVDTGEVVATVSANGNVATGTTVNADFQDATGVVTRILVEPGDRVRKGQVLARSDRTDARQSLQQALTQLASAQASYAATVEGQTPQERALDSRNVAQAATSVDSAASSLRSARASLSLTVRQQDDTVDRAAAALERALEDLEQAQDRYDADPSEENRQAVETARSTVTTARSSLATARQSRASAVLQARQQVASAADQLQSARASLASTEASVAVNQQGARESSVDGAQAQVDSAAVTVAQARTTLAGTVLRAPVAGTVAAVNGTVGEPATSTASTGSSSTSSADTSSSSSTTDASGFVTLTDTDTLQVTADVAEADIADVAVGQSATVTLSASGKELAATVTAVDAIETVTNNVVEYGVTVTLDRAKGVKLGQSTQVVITTGSEEGVVRVTSSALTTIGDTTTATVQSSDGDTSTVEVVTGLEGDGYTEVLDGLAPGDTVVLPQQSETGTDFTFPGGGGLGGLG